MRPENPFSPKQPDIRIAVRREASIELGENKGDKYGNRWEASRIRGPRAPRMNNSNEDRNEGSIGND